MLANNQYINRNPDYIGVPVEIGVFPTVTALIPLIYHVPTIYVISNIAHVYFESLTSKKELSINPHVAFFVVLHQISTLICIIFDYIVVRIPATGILTEWCASQEPSHLFKFLFWIPIYSYFLSNVFPFIIAVLRLILIYYPANNKQKNQKLVRFATPLILIYPLAFTWFLIPALGVCRQFPPPYNFGAAYIHFIGSSYDLKTAPFVMVNSTVWLILSIVANIFLYQKMKTIGGDVGRKSKKQQKAELTLKLTTVMILVLYSTNCIFMVIFAVSTRLTAYLILFRSTGSDLEAVIVPWIFFLVHPAFKTRTNFTRRLIGQSFPRRIDIKTVSASMKV